MIAHENLHTRAACFLVPNHCYSFIDKYYILLGLLYTYTSTRDVVELTDKSYCLSQYYHRYANVRQVYIYIYTMTTFGILYTYLPMHFVLGLFTLSSFFNPDETLYF